MRRCGECGTRLILDECFAGFLDEPERHTAKGLLEGSPGLLILRAFTKLYGMAGVRLGYALCADTAYLEAMRRCGGTKLTTLFMGDQLFTDIYGANRAGLKSILVKPIFLDPEFQIRLKRLGERIVMPFYFRYRKKHPASL